LGSQAKEVCHSFHLTLYETLTLKFKPSTYARYLYDAVYLYALALNQTLKQTGNSADLQNGALIANNKSFSFNG
jgi:hypothetical protein